MLYVIVRIKTVKIIWLLQCVNGGMLHLKSLCLLNFRCFSSKPHPDGFYLLFNVRSCWRLYSHASKLPLKRRWFSNT